MRPGAKKVNYFLAILATLAGLAAAFTNHSDKNNLYPDWKYKSIRVEGEKFRTISASHLADLIYAKDQGLALVDIRPKEAYEEYHIPGAIHITDSEPLSQLGSFESVVLCGSDALWKMEEALPDIKGKTYLLKGGLEEWYRIVLFPDFSEMQIRNRQTLESVINRSRYFGGRPKNTQHLNITLRSSQFREGC